jgi:hypothetical protein
MNARKKRRLISGPFSVETAIRTYCVTTKEAPRISAKRLRFPTRPFGKLILCAFLALRAAVTARINMSVVLTSSSFAHLRRSNDFPLGWSRRQNRKGGADKGGAFAGFRRSGQFQAAGY